MSVLWRIIAGGAVVLVLTATGVGLLTLTRDGRDLVSRIDEALWVPREGVYRDEYYDQSKYAEYVPNVASEANGDRITLRQHGCYGTCGVFTITITPGDVMFYERRAFAALEDEETGQDVTRKIVQAIKLPDGTFRKMVESLNDHYFARYRGGYFSGYDALALSIEHQQGRALRSVTFQVWGQDGNTHPRSEEAELNQLYEALIADLPMEAVTLPRDGHIADF